MAELATTPPSTTARPPLTGIKVVEIGRYIAAPYAGRLLADLGAEVVKVESADGDPMRRWESAGRPYSPQFAAYNRGKSSIVIDLATDAGRERLLTLVRGSDVLLENFRPGVMARLQLPADRLLAENPRLIYCAITGFGPTGPYSARPSYDTVISAMSGLYSLLLPADDPSPVGPAFSDLLSGLFACQGILAALHHRDVTGQGQILGVSMLGSVLDVVGEAVTSVAESGRGIQPNTRQRRAQAYGATASDGLSFIVHLSVPDKFWHALCAAMDRPDWLDDPRLATRGDRYTNYRVLSGLLREQAATRTRAEWFERFLANDLPHAPLNALDQLADDPQVRAMGLVRSNPMPDGRPMIGTAPPVTFSASPLVPAGPAPALDSREPAVTPA